MPRRGSGDRYSDSERLSLFVARCDELLAEPAALDGFRIGFTIEAAVGEEVRAEFREPPSHELRSYLLTFRQFVSDDEPVFVPRVHNILYTRIDDSDVRSRLAAEQQAWKRANADGAMRLEVNGVPMSPERALKLWINGRYFHSDREAAAELDRLVGLPSDFVRHAALDLIVETTNHVVFLASIIDWAREEHVLAI